MAEDKGKTNGMVAADWRPFKRAADSSTSLQGHFQLELTSGLVIHGLSYHKKGSMHWVGLPSQRFQRADGGVAYSQIIGFANDQIEKNFRDQALRALDALLAKQQKPETSEEPGS